MPGLFDALDAPSRISSIVQVAVERGVDRYPDGLSYAVPDSIGTLGAGDRVLVPLGRGNTPTAGFVIDVSPQAETSTAPSSTSHARRADILKSVLRRDDAGISLPPTLVELARWISAYYACPIGVTLGAILPAAVKKQAGVVTRKLIDLAPESAASLDADTHAEPDAVALSAIPATPEEPDAPKRPRPPRLSPQQRAVLEHLRGLPPAERPIEIRALAEALQFATTSPIDGLVRRGLLVMTRRTAVEAAWGPQALDATPPRTLTPHQVRVVDAVGAALEEGFSAHLLFGVTGSGKTEVYLRLFGQVLAAGRIALMLVPEIALTPQTGGRVIARFPGHRVAILHSGLSAAQRNHQWSMVARGEASIVLGARSAILAPLPAGRLGIIVVDEEHDASYKQDQAPRYHGRDAALRRGQIERCPVLLGSATPSLESWHNAVDRGICALHRLPHRAPGLTVPAVEVVDFLAERRARDPRDRHIHLIGPTLEQALDRTLAEQGQALLLLNRRGWANYIACPDARCGWKLLCPECDAMMVCHVDRAGERRGAGRYVRCHHCLGEQKLPETCPRCGNRTTVFGLGTQRVEDELERKFAGLKSGRTMLRVDADTTEHASALHDALARFGRGEVRVLLGTQMIAKGLDFPGVRLVGVISADTALALPDFRSAERTFQLVAQVAGRCGRGAGAGRAIVQTFEPELPAIVLAARHDYETFATAELDDRRRCGLPPETRMVRIVVRHADVDRCVTEVTRLAARLRHLADAVAPVQAAAAGALEASGTAGAAGSNGRTGERPGGHSGGIELRGPFPCPIARIAGRHRQQIELLAPRAVQLQALLAAARGEGVLVPGEMVAVDVDPISML